MGLTDHILTVDAPGPDGIARPARMAMGAQGRRIDPTPGAELADRLRDWDERRRAAGETAGCLQLLALEPLRVRFGPRWPTIGEKVHAALAHCLERGLGDADAYVPLGDDLYLVMFGRHDRDQGATRARLIAANATARMFGTNPGGTCIAVRPLPGPPTAILGGVATLEGLEERIALAERPMESRERRLWRELEPSLRLGWAPVACLRKGLVSIYRAELTGADGAPAARLLEDRGAEVALPDLDLTALDHAARALPGLCGRGRKAVLMVPVHYGTIAGMATRRRYLGVCRRMPDRAWRRLLLELVGLPDSLPHVRVQEVVGYLKPFANGVVWRTEGPPVRPERLVHTGAVGLALETNSLPDDPALAFERLELLVEAGQRHRLDPMLLGIEKRRLVRLARQAGVAYVSGPALHAPLERPGRTLRFGRARAEPQTSGPAP